MSVKGKVFNDRKNRYVLVNRFRNCDIIQHLTTVDVGEVVRSGGCIVEIVEGFICDNLEFKPIRKINYIYD